MKNAKKDPKTTKMSPKHLSTSLAAQKCLTSTWNASPPTFAAKKNHTDKLSQSAGVPRPTSSWVLTDYSVERRFQERLVGRGWKGGRHRHKKSIFLNIEAQTWVRSSSFNLGKRQKTRKSTVQKVSRDQSLISLPSLIALKHSKIIGLGAWIPLKRGATELWELLEPSTSGSFVVSWWPDSVPWESDQNSLKWYVLRGRRLSSTGQKKQVNCIRAHAHATPCAQHRLNCCQPWHLDQFLLKTGTTTAPQPKHFTHTLHQRAKVLDGMVVDGFARSQTLTFGISGLEILEDFCL